MFVAFPVGILWPESMDCVMAVCSRYGGIYCRMTLPWLDMVRSELVGEFLGSKKEELLFIDADNWFGLDVVESMRLAHADVITATYRKRSPPHQFVVRVKQPKLAPMRMVEGKRFGSEVEGRRIIVVDGDGLGCCLIRRHVLEKLWASHPELEYANEAGALRRNIFEYGIFRDEDGTPRAGQEDRAFFERVKGAGFKIECLADATVFHGAVPGNFGADVLDAVEWK
jgi:hypothetical protein